MATDDDDAPLTYRLNQSRKKDTKQEADKRKERIPASGRRNADQRIDGTPLSSVRQTVERKAQEKAKAAIPKPFKPENPNVVPPRKAENRRISAKRSIARVKKNLNTFDINTHTNTVEEVIEQANSSDRPIGWQPNSQVQIDFLSAWEDEVLFSGGRGSGKSDCLLVDPLRWVHNRNFRGLIIRRTMKELRELIDRAKRFYLDFFPNTKWKEQEKLFVFPSGARIEFGYCDSIDDVEQYRGQQYTWLGIDEITQFADPTMLDKLKASLRSTDPSLPIYIRATTNPSGPGCTWVKGRWVDLGAHGETTYKNVTIRGRNGAPDKVLTVTRKWFNSVPQDNAALAEDYLASLGAIDNEILRRQWLYGEWVTDGLAFDEFSREKHVIKPFNIPHNWQKFRACDWGFMSLAVCLWFAVDFDNNVYIYREYVDNGPQLKTEDRKTADKFALQVLEREAGEGVRYGILDSSVWAQRGQMVETEADTMIRMGCFWSPSDRSPGSRKSRKQIVHQYLAVDPETEKPKLFIFDTCKELIEELSSLPLDPHNPEDVNTRAKDHAYDALGYGLASRPLTWYSNKRDHNSFSRDDQHSSPVNSIFGY